MIESTLEASPLAEQPTAALGWRASHQRVRLAFYAVFATIALALFFQLRFAERDQQQLQAKTELVRLAENQASLGDAVSRLAAVGALSSTSDDLDQALQNSQAGFMRLDAAIRVWKGDAMSPAVFEAHRTWSQQTELVWYRAERVLTQMQSPATDLRAAVEGLQAAADPARQGAAEMAKAVRLDAQQAHERMYAQMAAAGTLVLLLLLAAAALVVEPTVRAVRRQVLQLRDQSQRLQQLALVLQQTHTSVVVTDEHHCVNWVNEAFTRQTGYEAADIIGRSVSAVLRPPAPMQEVHALMDEKRAAGEGFRVEVMNRRRDGSHYWADLDVRPWRDATGRLQGFVGVEADITEQVMQRQRLSALLAALPVGVLVHDSEGGIVDCNPAAASLLGMDREHVLSLKPDEVARTLRRGDGTAWTEETLPHMRSLATGQACSGEVMGFVNAQGDLRWLLVNTEPLPALHAEGKGVLSSFTDITEQKVQQQLLALTVDGSGMGLWQWDIRSNAMTGNERLFRMLGYVPGDIGGHLRDWVALVHGEDRQRWMDSIQNNLLSADVPYAEELRLRCADGRWASVMSYGTVVERDAQGEPTRMAGVHIDVTEQTRLREQLMHSAHNDALTGLPNRTAVLERISQAIARWRGGQGSRFAVLFMDLDRFKQVNDLLGHAAGDELLRQVAKRLQAALRAGDSVIRADETAGLTAARLGGDEFVVVLEGLKSPGDAAGVAQRLAHTLAQPYQIHGSTVHSGASIGIVDAEAAVDDANGVLRDADTAMYEAKRLGKGQHVEFALAMRESAERKNGLEADLRAGMQRGELHVVFQPVVDLSDGRLVAVEALARWTHPVRGAVSPVEFIPVAEEAGLIGELGRIVLKRACEAFADWRRDLGALAPKLLAVNLSRAQLKQPNLAEEVHATLLAAGVPPDCVQLEVTESLAAQDEQVQRALRELKALGMKLALDDFGTGYSSLACLHLLPVDTVKIDRSFVRHAESSEHHRVLIEATIRVARSLGMSTVAEGVETAGQALLLHSLECDKGQGWLYSKPLEEAALRRWALGGDAALVQAA